MTDTLKRLVGPVALGTSAATVYTSPASTQTMTRRGVVCNETSGELLFTLSIGADGSGKRLYREFPIPANLSFPIPSLDQVLEAGEILQAYGSGAGLTLTLTGVQITA